MSKIMIIMASKGDLDHTQKITKVLEELEVPYFLRVASAHKIPLKVLEIIKEHEKENVVYITIAGRSNALSAFVDASTSQPVIACPPYSEKFGGTDIFSSLRMPSGVCPLFILEPDQAALAAAKILALSDNKLRTRIADYQEKKRDELAKDDKALRKSWP